MHARVLKLKLEGSIRNRQLPFCGGGAVEDVVFRGFVTVKVLSPAYSNEVDGELWFRYFGTIVALTQRSDSKPPRHRGPHHRRSSPSHHPRKIEDLPIPTPPIPSRYQESTEYRETENLSVAKLKTNRITSS